MSRSRLNRPTREVKPMQQPIRRLAVLPLAALALACAAGTARAQTLPGVEDVDFNAQTRDYNVAILREYQKVMDQWRQAWERKDARGLASIYTPAAYVVFEDGNPVQGSGAIQALFQSRLADKGSVRTGVTDFVASDRLAYAIGSYVYEEKEADGTLREVTGTFVSVLVRDRDHWKLRSQVLTPTVATGEE